MDAAGWSLKCITSLAGTAAATAPSASAATEKAVSSTPRRPATPELEKYGESRFHEMMGTQTLEPAGSLPLSCGHHCRSSAHARMAGSTVLPRLCTACLSYVRSPRLSVSKMSMRVIASQLGSLQLLELDASELTDGAVGLLAQPAVCLGLHTLQLYRCQQLTDSALETLSLAAFAPLLKVLAFADCPNELGPGLERLLRETRGLGELCLRGTRAIRAEALQTMNTVLGWNIRSISLSGCIFVTSELCKTLFRGAANLGSDWPAVVAESQGFPLLSALDLSYSGPAEAASIAEALASCHFSASLTSLSLQGLAIDSTMLGAIVERCQMLTKLDVGFTAVCCQGLRVLLEHCCALRELSLDGCQLLDDLSLAVLSAHVQLPPHGALTIVSVLGCSGMTPRRLSEFAAAAQREGTLVVT